MIYILFFALLFSTTTNPPNRVGNGFHYNGGCGTNLPDHCRPPRR
jgi:hypothetical protein